LTIKKWLFPLIPLVVLLVVAVALVKQRQAQQAAEPRPIIPPVTVTTRTLVQEEVLLTRPALAEVRAQTEVVVASRLSGYVLEMPKVEGQSVKQGETLARLDATQAEADLARGVAEFTRSRQQEATLQAERDATRSALTVEEQRLQRLRTLYRDKNVSLEQVQAEEALMSATRAKLASAEAAFNSYQDALRAAESSLRAARENLHYATLIAPFDGVIAARLAQPGDLATPGKALYRLVSTGESRWLVDLPQTVHAVAVRLNGEGELLPLTAWPEATTQGLRRFEAQARHGLPGSRLPVQVVVYHGQAVLLPDDCLLATQADQATLLKVVTVAEQKPTVQTITTTLTASGVEGQVSLDAGLVGSQVLCGSADVLTRVAAGAPPSLIENP
jgi:multidrug efflux pump subunit AcrA (membrane-fusion protein)